MSSTVMHAQIQSIISACAFVNQVIAIPHVFIAREAEEVIGDATFRGGEADLIRAHRLEYYLTRLPTTTLFVFQTSTVRQSG